MTDFDSRITVNELSLESEFFMLNAYIHLMGQTCFPGYKTVNFSVPFAYAFTLCFAYILPFYMVNKMI